MVVLFSIECSYTCVEVRNQSVNGKYFYVATGREFQKIPCYFPCYQGIWPRFVLVGDNIKCVGRVERSETHHQRRLPKALMSFASLNPSYGRKIHGLVGWAKAAEALRCYYELAAAFAHASLRRGERFRLAECDPLGDKR
jgi:hypothetical protein